MNGSPTLLTRPLVALMCALTTNASGSFVEYQDKAAWQAAVGQVTTITFVEFPANTNITTQYANQGVTFTDGQDLILPSVIAFPNDGWGLNGAFDTIAVAFGQPMTTIAVDFPGDVQFQLYSQGQLIYTSNILGMGGYGNFAGITSTQAFDSAVILDPFGDVFIDDLHFGPPIPAPPMLALLVLTGFTVNRRRRTA